MYILHTLTALAALAAAVPLEERAAEGETIQLAAVPRLHRRSAAIGIERAMSKYGAEVPEAIRAEAAAARTGTVTANNLAHDQAYVAPVQIGTPAQTVMMDIDTGSSDMWVYSSMTGGGASAGHSIYTPAKSSTSKRLKGYHWAIMYGDGTSASGVVYSDKVVVGGVTAARQAVEVATSVAPALAAEAAIDGIFGFAYKNLNMVRPIKQNPWPRNAIPNHLFAAHLGYHKPGFYNIGFIDKSAYRGSIVYTPNDKSMGFYMIRPSGFTVGGTKHRAGFAAIVDTGTSLNFVPQSVAAAYYSHVAGAGQSLLTGIWTFPCSSSLPDFGFIFHGQARTMPGKYVKYAAQGGTCEGGIQTATSGTPNIIGDVYLKSQYVVFDRTHNRLGFAQQ